MNMSIVSFVVFILTCTSVVGQLKDEYLERLGLSEEDFNYVQSKLGELNNLVGKSLGIKPAPPHSDDVLLRDRGDVIYYTRGQIDFLINYHKKQQNRPQNRLLADSPSGARRSRPSSRTSKPRRRKNRRKGKNRKERKKRKIIDFDTFTLYPSLRWELPITFTIDRKFSDDKTQMILDAVKNWEEHTCIRFNRITDENSDIKNFYLHFENRGTCATYSGQVQDFGKGEKCEKCPSCRCPQVITGLGCRNMGQFMHEIGHAIGFIHEQSREDRDQFVTVNGNNINDGMHNVNFAKVNNARTYNIPYDVGSVMHYSGFINGLNPREHTISTINPFLQKTIGQRAELSFFDKKVAHLEYCSDICRSLPCKRGGFVDSNDCSKCVCPDGFSGKLCEDVATNSPNCKVGGEIFLADTEEICRDISPNAGDVYQCNLRIHTRKGWKIQVHKQKVDIEDCDGTHCCLRWLEIKYQHDLQITGPRYCGRETKTDKIVSESNEVMIVLKNNKPSKRTTAEICYRAVDPVTKTTPVPDLKKSECTTLGPVGDESRGRPFSDETFKNNGKITKMEICTSKTNGVLSSLQFTHGTKLGPAHGRKMNENCMTETLADDEYIVKVDGFASKSIWELTFHTNKGKTIGPHGANFNGHKPFSFESKGQHLAYIEGRHGDLVDLLKFIFCDTK